MSWADRLIVIVTLGGSSVCALYALYALAKGLHLLFRWWHGG